MILDFTQDGALKIDMKYYIQGMLDEFPFEVKPSQTTPWTEKLFKVQEDAKKLDKEQRSIFHTFVMKAMFMCKRALLKGMVFTLRRYSIRIQQSYFTIPSIILRRLCVALSV
jgi:hypothetical protein